MMKANGYIVLVLASMATVMDSMGPMAESMMPMPTQSEASPMPPTSSPLLLPTDMVSSYEVMATGTAVSVSSDEPAHATTTSMAVDSSETETSSTGMADMSSMATVSTESMDHYMGTGGMMPNATGTATAPGQQPPISVGISVYPGSVGFFFALAVLGAVLVM